MASAPNKDDHSARLRKSKSRLNVLLGNRRAEVSELSTNLSLATATEHTIPLRPKRHASRLNMFLGTSIAFSIHPSVKTNAEESTRQAKALKTTPEVDRSGFGGGNLEFDFRSHNSETFNPLNTLTVCSVFKRPGLLSVY